MKLDAATNQRCEMAEESWIRHFPGLAPLEPAVRSALNDRSRIVAVGKGSVIFGPGKAPENMLLLIDGTVRVQQVAESGREIVLYRVSEGESCILTTACLLACENYSAEGIAETDVTAVAIPRQTFDDLIARSAAFRTFVFTAYSKRIMELFFVIQEIAFSRIDIRLAQALRSRADQNDQVHLTHQQLANELGTAREVVSRHLQEFQRRNWIATARGQIRIVDTNALSGLAETR